MSTVTESGVGTPCAPAVDAGRTRMVEERIRASVWNVVAALHPCSRGLDRRSDQRFPLARLVRLTPLAADGVTPLGEAVVAAGKDLSERGLSFFHPQPLAFRRVLAELELAPAGSTRFVVDLSWCRFTRTGWYESGGRFIDVCSSNEQT